MSVIADTRTDLFEPFQLGPYRLRNRIVMSPMTRNRSPGEVPGTLNIDYYKQRASAGLIVSESTAISPKGLGWKNSPGIFSDAQIAGWRAVTSAVHARGGRQFLQLWHCGRCSHFSVQPDGQAPVGPSAIQSPGMVRTSAGRIQHSMPRALERHELPGIVSEYRAAAANAIRAGFDGVEIHAANGYFLDQFLRDASNQRTDDYGGSAENRARLLFDVATAIADEIGANRVGVRISPVNVHNGMSDSDPAHLYDVVVDGLNRFGLAYLHVVEGATDPNSKQRPFDWERLRRQYRGTYLANNEYTKARAVEARRNNRADLFSFGRLYIANPDLVERFRRDAPLNPLNQDTVYLPDHRGYTDYPALQ